MALVVETGTGSSTAESYISVIDADNYFTNYGANAIWAESNTSVKEAALRTATMVIDSQYKFRGQKYTQEQALEWPREFVYDDADREVSVSTIPQCLKFATAELAARQLSSGLLADVNTPGQIKRTKVEVGPLLDETEYTEAGGDQTPAYPKVTAMLKNITESSGRADRG